MLRSRSLSSSAFGLREVLLDAGEAFYALHKHQALLELGAGCKLPGPCAGGGGMSELFTRPSPIGLGRSR